MTRAIGYARMSKPKRKKDGTLVDDPFSIEIQRDAITDAAKLNGWDLLDVLKDNGKSGEYGRSRRPGLDATLTALESGEADVLVIAKFDRLGRDARDWLNLLFDSQKQGWSISVLNDRIDTSTAVGWLHAAMQAVFAEYERRIIGERTKTVLAIKKASGQQLGKPSTISKQVQRRILKLHREGVSASEIADRLTKAGIKNPSKTGTQWYHSTVARLIKRSTSTKGKDAA